MKPNIQDSQQIQLVFSRTHARLRHLLFPGKKLSQRAVVGGIWVFGLRIVNQGFGLIRTIILARLLAPNDFGLYGIALLSLSALQTFSKTGFDLALIQKKEDTGPYLDTAWTVQVIRGFVLAAILFLAAPLVAAFFAEPRAAMLVRVLGVAVLLEGFRNIGVIYFNKELKFHKQFAYQFSGTLADLAVAIPAAFILRSVWALVFGLLAGNLVRTVMSYFIHSYRPRLSLEKAKFSGLFGFGKWIWGETIAIFLTHEGDDVLVGKLFGASTLGLYRMAYRISNLAATEISNVLCGVTFPAYSKLQSKRKALREAYLRTLQLTGLVAIPLAGGIAVLAPEFTKILLGQRWMAMVPALQLLAIWGMERSIIATTPPVFMALGVPKQLTRLALIRLVIMAIVIYPLSIRWGIVGTAGAVLIAAMVADPFGYFWILGLIDCKISDFFRVLFPSLAATGTMIAAVYVAKTMISLSPMTDLGILLILAVSTFAGVSYILDKTFRLGVMESLGYVLRNLNVKEKEGVT